jgi:hypothetical protein
LNRSKLPEVYPEVSFKRVPAEVWNAAKRCDAMLLEPEGDGLREYPFSTVRARVNEQSLELYPAIHRISVAGE